MNARMYISACVEAFRLRCMLLNINAMTTRTGTLLAFLLVLSACGDEAARQGRRGNALYAEERYQEAVQAYQAGLQALSEREGPQPMRTGLWNNLGAAYHRQEAYSAADSALGQAIATAFTEAPCVRAQSNARNNAFQQKETEAALSHYKQALLTNPAYEEARFNYEYVKRRQKKQAPQQQNRDQQQREQENLVPSDYAKELKRQADALVARRKYKEAHRLLVQGKKVDRTVGAYKTFISRVGDVSEIDEAPSGLTPSL